MAVTYNSIVTIVKNYAKQNCKNISNFASIPAYYKAGYTYTVGNITANFIDEGGNFTINNPITAVSKSTVDTDMTTFLNKVGVPSNALNYPIDDLNLNNFMLNMIVFCSSKMFFAVSRPNNNASTERILVYYTGGTFDYTKTKTIKPVSTGNQNYTYSLSDIQDTLNKFFSALKSTIRVVPLTFTFSCY